MGSNSETFHILDRAKNVLHILLLARSENTDQAVLVGKGYICWYTTVKLSHVDLS
jgi:hypothetical protein